MNGAGAELVTPRWLKKLGELPDTVTQAALKDSRDFLREEARKNASGRVLNTRSGRLLRSIRTYLKSNEVTLGSVFYGKVQNTGATITGRPYLTFNIPGGGFRKKHQVVLPARPWASDALEATRKVIPRYVEAALERFTRS